MKIHSSATPALHAGQHISSSINDHPGDILCLLAGGSALDVSGYISLLPTETQRRTIFIMGDERMSREPDVNNSLQVKSRYPDSPVTANLIPTVPGENETHKAFTERIRSEVSAAIETMNNPKIIALLGVGVDGHTASIFPKEWEDFVTTYKEQDPMYVAVRDDKHQPELRTTFTPDWLVNQTNELVVYITGEEKDHVLFSFVSDHKSQHERPAELIKLHIQAHVYTDINLSLKN